jgi:hypothetical protein
MASTYSTNLKIELIGTGEQAGTWGNTTNTNLGTALEQAVVGKADVAMSSTTVTLTLTNANTAQDARAIYLNLTGSPGGAAILEVPAIEKPYIVNNGSDQQVTIKVSGQTGVPIPTTKTALVYNNGTDVVTSIDHIPSLTLGAALAAASGGTGLTSPGSSGNVLTSNGTAWTSAALPAGGIEYEVKTANYTAADKEGILADTSGGAFTVTLPATPATGAQVIVADPTGDWGTDNLTIGRNGETISDVAEDLICDISGVSVQLVYDGTTWAVYAQVGGNGGTVVTEDGTQTLTNKTINLTSNTLVATSAQLASAVTDETGTGALVFGSNPTLTGVTLAGEAACADNLVTRATLKDYAIEGSAIGNAGATRTFDLSVANFFSVTIDQATTFTFSNPPASGDFGAFVMEITNGAAFVITFPASVDWPGGTAPTLTASGVDQLVFTTRDNGTTYLGFVAGLDIKSP